MCFQEICEDCSAYSEAKSNDKSGEVLKADSRLQMDKKPDMLSGSLDMLHLYKEEKQSEHPKKRREKERTFKGEFIL